MSTDLPSFSFDPQPVVEVSPQTCSVGGFWRRFLAFAVDGLILGIVGWSIGAFFFDTLSQLGPWGKLVGFLVAVPYFAVMESSVGGGQSIGKRLLGLRVVDSNGNMISFERSFARYFVFSVPFFLNKLELPITRTPWIIIALLGVIVFGVGGVTFYLLIFNRNTRQGLHDLAVGSYVVKGSDAGPVKIRPLWKPHLAVAGALLALSVIVGITGHLMTKWGFFPELLQNLQLVEQMDGVQQGGAVVSWTYKLNGVKTKSLDITVVWSKATWNPAIIADQVARLILLNDPNAKDYDQLQIVVARTYDIGIASSWVSRPFYGTPAAWHERLFGALPASGSTQTHQ